MSLTATHSTIVSWNGTAFVTNLVTKPRATVLNSQATGASARLPAFRLTPRPARLRLDMKVSKKSSGDEAIRKPSSLEPEVTLYEGPPSWTELLLPGLSILTVIGVIPFSAALARQFWVRYRISNRSIYVRSGFMGREETEIVYRDIEEIRYVRRLGGVSADYVIMVKGGAKLELRAVPDFDKTYDFMMQRVSEEARERSNYKKDKIAN
ncbi:hypothetical protein CCYA_CCYA10G2823 [Cyanidiococcus yangmingshanensis]|nr:hypothetical protein CCYA_CCYA10G2823 [Cyanidiococcus yangmingshanensis]